ncbi:YebC/PmpR family DNA-binding transcriptional regulator [Candidatus Uhrbacteria bacterium]|nr:YebC/PmpR family DNA-binding transcriptional regulator [Candidatus Uhrbacteria bacterium]
MSGHNKWSKIKNKKGAADAKRGAIFTKLGKAITIAVREGGADPTMNFKLRIAIDAGRSANMPNENVDRAIKRGTGDGEGGEMAEGLFEAYGPSGVAFVIETLSDNKNRISADISIALRKSGANSADPGSVLYNFEKKAVVSFLDAKEKIKDADEFEMALIDAGAEDIEIEDAGATIMGELSSFQRLVEAVEVFGIIPDEASLQYVAKMPLTIDESTTAKVEKIIEALEELDDVQHVFTNVG